MKVLHVIHSLVRGGLENGVVNLLNHLPDDIEQSVACLDKRGEMADRVRDGVPIHVLDRQRNDIKLPFRLARLMKEIQPDVVHCRNWNAWLDTVAAHRIAGRPGTLVWSFHGFAGGAVWPTKRAMISRGLTRLTDQMFAVCHDSAQRYADFANVSADRFEVLYNGVDLARFTPHYDVQGDQVEARRALGLDPDKVLVTTVASLTPVKDHASLLRAVAALAQSHGDRVQFLFLGDGPLRGELEVQIEQSGIEDRVLMPGNTDRVPDYLQVSDVAVLPSRLEGMSNTILEAMATGLPVIANDVGGNPELIVAGETGLLAEQGNDASMAERLARLIDDPALRLQYGRAGRARAEQVFSIEAMMHHYAEYYRRIAP